MSELTDSLRTLADRIDRGEFIADPSQMAIVVGDKDGETAAFTCGWNGSPCAIAIWLYTAGIRHMLDKQQKENAGPFQ
tara:strand:- start:137 stop:370 length:234 start_codon:yes stop_codon:yes gene_type:complete